MSLHSKLKTAIRDPKKAILYIILGRPYYEKVMRDLAVIHQYLQIKPQTPLEDHALKCTDINEHLVTLYMLTKQMKLLSVLELGVRTGESTIVFLSAAKENGGTVTSIDVVDCPEAISKVDSLGLSKWWRFIRGDDLEVEWNKSIDHLFIDTSHTYDHTLKELQKFEPWVNAGGVITLHDIVAFPDILRAINDYLGEREELQLYKYFHNNGLAVIFKGAKR
jgi:predicted O-methyltransferase YrrM